MKAERYVTYGAVWERDVMRLPKKDIVEMLRNAGRALEKLKEKHDTE